MSDVKEPIPLAQRKSVDAPTNSKSSGPGVHDRSIGAIIAETRNLSADQVERVLQYQRERGIRFGEAAVALGYANAEDVLEALSKQFHYPYAPSERKVRSPELVALNTPFSSQAEVFRGIRSQITMRLYRENEPRRALAVISPDSLDGKSYFTANLAVTLAQLGGRTLLVDAGPAPPAPARDLRRQQPGRPVLDPVGPQRAARDPAGGGHEQPVHPAGGRGAAQPGGAAGAARASGC